MRGLTEEKKKVWELKHNDEKLGCMAGLETMCGQYIKKQSKEKEPVV